MTDYQSVSKEDDGRVLTTKRLRIGSIVLAILALLFLILFIVFAVKASSTPECDQPSELMTTEAPEPEPEVPFYADFPFKFMASAIDFTNSLCTPDHYAALNITKESPKFSVKQDGKYAFCETVDAGVAMKSIVGRSVGSTIFGNVSLKYSKRDVKCSTSPPSGCSPVFCVKGPKNGPCKFVEAKPVVVHFNTNAMKIGIPARIYDALVVNKASLCTPTTLLDIFITTPKGDSFTIFKESDLTPCFNAVF